MSPNPTSKRCESLQENARNRIIVALDVRTEDEAFEIVKMLANSASVFKVGLELLSSVGIAVIARLAERGATVFLDGKFMDIPNTVAGACKAVCRLGGVKMFNVHTLGGYDMMRAAVDAIHDESERLRSTRPLLLGVTILTSIDQHSFNDELRIPGRIDSQVLHLAQLAEKAGLDGIICSPQEIKAVQANTAKEFLIVTPGVRPVWAAAHDQKRVMTPGEAIQCGASQVVIGRPITSPPDTVGTPHDALQRVIDEIAKVLAGEASTQ